MAMFWFDRILDLTPTGSHAATLQVSPRIMPLRALCKPINNIIKWERNADRRYKMNIY